MKRLYILEVSILAITGFTVSSASSEQERGSRENKNRRDLDMWGIPSSTQRGAIRHCGAELVIEKCHEKGVKMRLDDAAWMSGGGIRGRKGEGEETANIMMQYPDARAHPFALFGYATPLFMGARLQIENAMPTTSIKPTLVKGQRTDLVQRPGNIHPDWLSDASEASQQWLVDLGVVKDQRRQEREATAKARRNGGRGRSTMLSATTDGEETAEKDAASGEKAEKSTKVPPNMPFSFEILDPGVTFSTFYEISDPTEEQLGLFVAALRRFSENPFFGAKARMNLGLVDMTIKTGGAEIMTIKGRDREFKVLSPEWDGYETAFKDKFNPERYRNPGNPIKNAA